MNQTTIGIDHTPESFARAVKDLQTHLMVQMEDISNQIDRSSVKKDELKTEVDNLTENRNSFLSVADVTEDQYDLLEHHLAAACKVISRITDRDELNLAGHLLEDFEREALQNLDDDLLSKESRYRTAFNVFVGQSVLYPLPGDQDFSKLYEAYQSEAASNQMLTLTDSQKLALAMRVQWRGDLPDREKWTSFLQTKMIQDESGIEWQ